jgi:hypothetical protein
MQFKMLLCSIKSSDFHLLDALVDDDTESVLGYVVDATCLTVIRLVGHTFLNSSATLCYNTYTCIILNTRFTIFKNEYNA